MNMITCPNCNAHNPDGETICFNCSSPLIVPKPSELEYALSVGSLLKNGRYSIGRILGQGGFGITYLCSDLKEKRTVTIKELFPQGCYRKGNTVQLTGSIKPDDFEQIKDKFIEEGQRLRKFNHHGIVKVFSTFEENNTAYIVMEYLEGQNLHDLVESKGVFSETEVIDITTRIGDALDYIHAKNYLHRDVKPSNVILTDDGRTVLIDFGSARQFAAETRKMTAILTPGYAPPEQYASKVRAAQSMDIYALGATMYFLLTGKNPEEAPNREKGFEIKPPQHINPKISQNINDVIIWMMHLQASKRPQTIPKLNEALKPKPPEPEPPPDWDKPTIVRKPALDWQKLKNLIPYVLVTIAVLIILFASFEPGGVSLTQKFSRSKKVHELKLTHTFNDESKKVECSVIAEGDIYSFYSGCSDGTIIFTAPTFSAFCIPYWELKVHNGPVKAIAVNPITSEIASTSTDKTIKILRSDEEDEESIIFDSISVTSDVLELVYSPDGEFLVSSFADRIVKVWSAAQTGKEIKTLSGNPGAVTSMVFSPDGEILAGGNQNGEITLWSFKTNNVIKTLSGHSGAVESLVLSPDGLQLASEGNDNSIRLWDVENGVQKILISSQTGKIESLCFNSDGTKLISGHSDNTIKVWSAGSGSQICILEGHMDDILDLKYYGPGDVLISFSRDQMVGVWDIDSAEGEFMPATIEFPLEVSPDGKEIVSFNSLSSFRIWSVESGKVIRSIHVNNLALGGSFAISHDNKVFAYANDDSLTIQVVSVNTGTEINSFSVQSRVASLEFSPDGNVLASGHENEVVLWNINTFERICSLASEFDVQSLCFSPDGNTLAASGNDGTIKLWSVESSTEMQSLSGHLGQINGLKFSPDGQLLATCGNDRTIRLWSVTDGKEIKILWGHNGTIQDVIFNSDGTLLASQSDDKTIKLWSVKSGEEQCTITKDRREEIGLIFTPNSDKLITGGATLKMWKMEEKNREKTKKPEKNEKTLKTELIRSFSLKSNDGSDIDMESVAFSPDGKLIAVRSDDEVRIFKADSGECINSFVAYKSNPPTNFLIRDTGKLFFSPDSSSLAVGRQDGLVELWNVNTGKEISSIPGSSDQSCHEFTFNTDSKIIASEWIDDTIILRSAETGREIRILKDHTDTVRSIAFNPDGLYLATANDETIKIWLVESGNLVRTLTGHFEPVYAVAYSPDGKFLVSGGGNMEDGGGWFSSGYGDGKSKIILWSVDTGEKIWESPGQPRPVSFVLFSPDSKLIASCERNSHTIKLWSVETGEELKTIYGHLDDVESFNFTPDGKTLISCSYDWAIKLWSIEYE